MSSHLQQRQPDGALKKVANPTYYCRFLSLKQKSAGGSQSGSAYFNNS